MNTQEKKMITRETVIEVEEIATLAKKLPEREKERVYFMMKGMELAQQATAQA